MKKHFTLFTVTLLVIFSGTLTPTYGQWPKYIVDDDNINTAVNVDAADLDGDSKLDLIVTNARNNELIYYQNNFPYWIKHIIDANTGIVTFAWSADINSNNKLDVVACLYGVGQIVWYENSHPTWTPHFIDFKTDNGDFICVASKQISLPLNLYCFRFVYFLYKA